MKKFIHFLPFPTSRRSFSIYFDRSRMIISNLLHYSFEELHSLSFTCSCWVTLWIYYFSSPCCSCTSVVENRADLAPMDCLSIDSFCLSKKDSFRLCEVFSICFSDTDYYSSGDCWISSDSWFSFSKF